VPAGILDPEGVLRWSNAQAIEVFGDQRGRALADVVAPSRRSSSGTRRHHLPEREHVCLDAGLEEFDLERPVPDTAVDTHELIEPAVGEHAVAFLVDVDAAA
jgi:hypothetical protein